MMFNLHNDTKVVLVLIVVCNAVVSVLMMFFTRAETHPERHGVSTNPFTMDRLVSSEKKKKKIDIKYCFFQVKISKHPYSLLASFHKVILLLKHFFFSENINIIMFVFLTSAFFLFKSMR